MLWAGAGASARQDLGVRGHKAAQGLRVFVVYSRDFVRAEIADFLDWWLIVLVIAIVVVSHILKWNVFNINIFTLLDGWQLFGRK